MHHRIINSLDNYCTTLRNKYNPTKASVFNSTSLKPSIQNGNLTQ